MHAFRFTFLLLFALLAYLAPAGAVNSHLQKAAKEEVARAEAVVKKGKETTRAERREMRKEVRKTLKERFKAMREAGETDTLLLVIIAILLPPLAMLIYEGGLTSRFWLSLLLTLLFYLPGLIYTLYIILSGK